MHRLRLLHIGDIHYPDKQGERLDDVKDDSFPTEVAQQMVQIPLQAVLRAASLEIAERPVNGYLISGDLTSRGDIAQYGACLDVVINALSLRSVPSDRIHAVPGNHDFDRASVDPTCLDMAKKFSGISQAWDSRGISVLTVQNVRETRVKSGPVSAALYSLNSCLGCGEKRYLPTEIADQLAGAITAYSATATPSDAFSLAGERLDSPGFVEAEINDLCESVQRLAPNVVPVVLSHHNLLPQAILRIAIYTEVMNAGRVRSRFSGFRNTVLYCHGHIHDDPVEVIQTPDNHEARIVAISAPELARGFNVIQLEYGEQGTPLGCKVIRFKYNLRDGSVRPEEVRVGLTRLSYQRAIAIGHSGLKRALSTLGTKELRFADAFSKMGWADNESQKGRFAEVLEEAEWLGLVDIVNRRNEPEYWWVTKVVR